MPSHPATARHGFAWSLLVALISSALAVGLRALLNPVFGSAYPFIFSFAAVAVSAAYGGWLSGVAATVFNYAACTWLFAGLGPDVAHYPGIRGGLALVSFCMTCGIITALAEAMRRARRRSVADAEQRAAASERLHVTLRSIGDAVIATDGRGAVTFLNPVAERLTGWPSERAVGAPLAEVFRIVNESTREAVESPVAKVLAEGNVIGLANHTVLLRPDGSETAIADSAAPILTPDGAIEGVVLVFRDVGEERRAEEAFRKRTERAQLLSQTLEKLLAAQDATAIVRELCPKVAAHIGADAFLNFMVTEKGDALQLHVIEGLPEETLPALQRLEFGEAICGTVALTRHAIIATNIQESDYDKAALVRSLGIQAYACNPLLAGERLLGTLSFASRTRTSFAEDELEFLRAISQHVALAVDRLERESSLRQNERRLAEQARLLDLSNDAIIVCDWEDRILSWNRGAEEIYGWPREEALGKAKHVLLHTEFQEPREVVTRKLLATNRWEGELVHTRRDGSRIVVSTRWSLDRDANGDPAAVLKSDNDVTARRAGQEALRQSETRLRMVADSIPALVSYVDRGQVYRFANAAYLEWFGTKPEEMIGRSVRDLIGEEWYEQRRPHIAAVLRGEEVRLEAPTPHRQKGERRTEVYYVPDRRGGEVHGFYAFVHDITERVAAQRALEEQAVELRQASRRKDEFLAMLAHELRNPLASVSNAAALLQNSDEPENRTWALEVLQRQTGQLSRLIEDLLDVSRITSGKIRLRKTVVDAGAILRAAAEATEALIEERNHRLSIETNDAGGPLSVEADPTRLEQIVTNLLTNAAKYTEAGGQIWLTAAREEGSAGRPEVVLRVRDTGVGIPPEKIPEMFELFAQGERSIARSEGGLGIGLTIVRKLSEMHGGAVSAHSEGPGKGSEFTVRLPAATAAVPASPASLPVPRNGAEREPSRILVVDDNIDTARGLARLMALFGHTVETAHDGASALEAARTMRPEFVLLDIGLPGMDGYEVCERLRLEESCAGARIIAISGYGQDEDRRRSRAAGFDHHLVKPVELGELKALLVRG